MSAPAQEHGCPRAPAVRDQDLEEAAASCGCTLGTCRGALAKILIEAGAGPCYCCGPGQCQGGCQCYERIPRPDHQDEDHPLAAGPCGACDGSGVCPLCEAHGGPCECAGGGCSVCGGRVPRGEGA